MKDRDDRLRFETGGSLFHWNGRSQVCRSVRQIHHVLECRLGDALLLLAYQHISQANQGMKWIILTGNIRIVANLWWQGNLLPM